MYDISNVQEVGSVILCNDSQAAVYSPYYEDGIGVVLFDAVNSFANIHGSVVLEIATNTLDDVHLASENYHRFVWIPCPVDVLKRTRGFIWGAMRDNVTVEGENQEYVTLNATSGADGQTFRIRANVFHFLNGYRGPIRFRIKRKDLASGSLDSAYLLLDNIVATYPPMTAEIQPMGHYWASTTGSAVIGLEGAFDPPFLALGQTNVHMAAFCTYVTNVAEIVTDVTESFQLSNAKVVGRHRYLNQTAGPWQIADMAVDGSLLTTTTGFNLPALTGDWEFYFTADQNAP
jgi:hypothetical protein